MAYTVFEKEFIRNQEVIIHELKELNRTLARIDKTITKRPKVTLAEYVKTTEEEKKK